MHDTSRYKMKLSLVRQLLHHVSISLLCLLMACNAPNTATSNQINTKEYPKNIVLMIGDGMGLSQISAAMYSNRNNISLEDFPVIGFHKSYAANDLITDSAAGATAFSIGEKTYNGAIGLNVDTIPQLTILEEAIQKELSTGIVVTSSITHATPASFYAHQQLRVMHEQIAADLLDNPVNFLIGGGRKYFERRTIDNRNLVEELRLKNYQVKSFTEINLDDVTIGINRNFLYFTADKEPLPVTQGRTYLPYASRLALNYLQKHSKTNGFFLMIEGSQIDWAGHANEGRLVIQETLDFNKTIEKVLSFAKRDRETLVIVTADHETGGFALQPDSKMGKIKTAFTTNGHTASLVPIFAYGPGAELFHGIYENTAIYTKMRQALGWE